MNVKIPIYGTKPEYREVFVYLSAEYGKLSPDEKITSNEESQSADLIIECSQTYK